MKQFIKKYSFAFLSISLICSYFVFTGGITEPSEIVPEVTIGDPSTTLVNTVCQITVTLDTKGLKYSEESDNGCGGKTTTDYDHSPIGTIAVTDAKNNLIPITKTETRDGNKRIIVVTCTFNEPGTYVFKVTGSMHPSSDLIFVNKSIVITGTPKLDISKYKIYQFNVQDGVTGKTMFHTFTTPDTSQYLELFTGSNAHLRFKYTPSAAELTTAPCLENSYDQDKSGTYVLTKGIGETSSTWFFNLIYDGSAEVDFISSFTDGSNLWDIKYSKTNKTDKTKIDFYYIYLKK